MDVAVTPCDILSSRSTRSMTTVESSHTGGNVLESCVRQLHYVGGKYLIEQLGTVSLSLARSARKPSSPTLKSFVKKYSKKLTRIT
jgi:adenylate cyclase